MDNLHRQLVTQHSISPETYIEHTAGLALMILDDAIYAPSEVAIHFCSWLNPVLSVQVNEALRRLH